MKKASTEELALATLLSTRSCEELQQQAGKLP